MAQKRAQRIGQKIMCQVNILLINNEIGIVEKAATMKIYIYIIYGLFSPFNR